MAGTLSKAAKQVEFPHAHPSVAPVNGCCRRVGGSKFSEEVIDWVEGLTYCSEQEPA